MNNDNTTINPLIENQMGHVRTGDVEAEFADRRNQPGQAFDENINEMTVRDDVPRSAQVNDSNRYASPQNAQTRTLNPDGSVPQPGSE